MKTSPTTRARSYAHPARSSSEQGKEVKHWPWCTDPALVLHCSALVLHCSARFIFGGDPPSRKPRKPKPPYPAFSLPKGMNRDFALAGTLPYTATTKRQENSARSSQRPRRVRAQSFACLHTVRFFGLTFSFAHAEIVSPRSLRDPPQSENHA